MMKRYDESRSRMEADDIEAKHKILDRCLHLNEMTKKLTNQIEVKLGCRAWN